MREFVAAACTVLLTLGGFLVWNYRLTERIEMLHADIAITDADLAEYEPVLEEMRESERRSAALEKRLPIIEDLEAQRAESFARAFEQLELSQAQTRALQGR